MMAPDWPTLSDDDLERRWNDLSRWIEHRFGRTPGIESILYLIGIQHLGIGFEPGQSKERRQEVIMEGTGAAFASIGLYEKTPHGVWKRSDTPVPELSITDQEKLLKTAILNWFQERYPESET